MRCKKKKLQIDSNAGFGETHARHAIAYSNCSYGTRRRLLNPHFFFLLPVLSFFAAVMRPSPRHWLMLRRYTAYQDNWLPWRNKCSCQKTDNYTDNPLTTTRWPKEKNKRGRQVSKVHSERTITKETCYICRKFNDALLQPGTLWHIGWCTAES